MSDVSVMYKDDDLLLLIEWDGDLPYLHHHFYTWSPTVLKKTIKEFSNVVEQLKQQGYGELWSYYDKDQVHVDKFCIRFGFVKVGETETQNIVLKEI